jgi:SAM-dependent methyltransferase
MAMLMPIVNCPICFSEMRERKIKAPVPLLDCKCGFISIDLRTWQYPYEEKDYYHASEMRFLESVVPWIAHRVYRVNQYLKSGVIADLGCGNGETVNAFTRAGYEAIGVEESKLAVEFLSSAYPSGRWHNSTILDYLRGSPQHDGLTLYHVLEHMPNPRKLCSILHESLCRGGVLVVEVPDVGSGQARLRGGRWQYYLPHHVNYFTIRTLRTLLEPFGFQLLECERKYNICTPNGKRWKDLAKQSLSTIGLHSIVSMCWRRL